MHDPGLVSSAMLAVELVAVLASVFSLQVDANLSTCKKAISMPVLASCMCGMFTRFQ